MQLIVSQAQGGGTSSVHAVQPITWRTKNNSITIITKHSTIISRNIDRRESRKDFITVAVTLSRTRPPMTLR